MPYIIYGRYIGRVRHSLLRRPYVLEPKVGTRVTVPDLDDILAVVRKPSAVNELEGYLAKLYTSRVVEEYPLMCANLHTPSRPYVPKEYCLYYIGGICDYLTTVVCTTVRWPIIIHVEDVIDLLLLRYPQLTELTKYLATIGRRPTVADLVEYIAKIAAEHAVEDVVKYTARLHRPYPAIELSEYVMSLQPLPRFTERTDVSAEVVYKGYKELTLKGMHVKDVVGMTVANSVFVDVPINVTVSYIPQTAIVDINLEVSDSLTIIPRIVIVGRHDKLFDVQMYRRNVYTSSLVSTLTYTTRNIVGRYLSKHDLYVFAAKLAVSEAEKVLSRYTAPNLLLAPSVYTEARLAKKIRGIYDAVFQPYVYSSNVMVASLQQVSQMDRIILTSRYPATYRIDLIYTPVVVIDSEVLRALDVYENVHVDEYERVQVFPYTVLTSRYAILYELTLSLISPEKIGVEVYQLLAVKRLYQPNLYAYTSSSVYQLPAYLLIYRPVYLSYDLPIVAASVFADAGSSVLVVLDRYAYLRGVYSVYGYAELKPVDYIQTYTATAVSTIRPNIITAESGTGYAFAVPIAVVCSSSGAVSAEYKYAVPIYVYLTDAPSVYVPYVGRVAESSYVYSAGAKSRLVSVAELLRLALSYAAANVLLYASNAVSVQHLTSNVLQQTKSEVLLDVYNRNVQSFTYADYTLSLDKYGTIAFTYSDVYLALYPPNALHADYSSYDLSLRPPNAAHTSQAKYEVVFAGTNTYHTLQSRHLLNIYSTNTSHQAQSSYQIDVYRQVNLAGSVAVDSKYALWIIRRLAGAVNTDSRYAVQINKSSIDIVVDLTIEDSRYVR